MNTPTDISFRFKQFSITDSHCGLKLGTDGVLLGAWTQLPSHGASTAVDAGTGCGIIALILAQRFPMLSIKGIEIDGDVCNDASTNFDRSPWSDRLSLCQMPFSEYKGHPDMIVSNPPFFTTGEHSPLRSRAISRHAATLSPFSLIDDASARLSQGGTLSLITPAGMEDEMICHATFAHMYLRRLCRVCTVTGKAPVRLLWEFSTTDCDNVEYTSLTLRNPDGTPTYRFRSLTHDLYLKF